jgi:hypothetical protein
MGKRFHVCVRAGYCRTDFKGDNMASGAVFSILAGVSKREIYKKFGAGLYYSLGLSDYTQYYQLRQITRVNGFVLMLTMTL